MRLLLLFILSPFLLLSQVQIGNDIGGLAAGDQSGYVSFSNDGTIVAIGGPGNDDAGEDAGHVRVFENVSGVWSQIGDDINGVTTGDNFGASLSLSGDGTKVAISSSLNNGNVRVFQNISNIWTQIGNSIIVHPEEIIMNVTISSDGSTVSIVVSSGLVRTYKNEEDTWTHIMNDIFYSGYPANSQLSSDGSTIVISFTYWDGWFGNYLVVVVYKNISNIWTLIGEPFYGYASGSADLSDDGLILAITSGNVTTVYEYEENQWSQINNTIENTGTNISLSPNGSIVAIGGGSTSEGKVQIFYNIDNSWTQIGSDINGESDGENFGSSLSLSSDGSTIAIGTPLNDDNGIDAGQVRVYDLSALLSVEESSLLSVKLYPNPTTNQFTIDLPLSHTLEKVNIYNNIGQFIQTSQKNIINTSKLSSGIYYVEVVTNEGKATKKLVIK